MSEVSDDSDGSGRVLGFPYRAVEAKLARCENGYSYPRRRFLRLFLLLGPPRLSGLSGALFALFRRKLLGPCFATLTGEIGSVRVFVSVRSGTFSHESCLKEVYACTGHLTHAYKHAYNLTLPRAERVLEALTQP